MSAGKKLPGTPEPMCHWPGAGGLRIAGDTWGPVDGPLVVFLHGGGQTRHAWKGTGQSLARAGYFAVAFDARGHGDSEWAADGQYGQDAMVEDLQRVVAALGNRRPALVGASMGGGTSLVAAGEEIIDAAALVLVDIAPRIEEHGVDHIRAFMSQSPDGFDSLEAVADAIASYQPHRPRPKNLGGLGKNVRLAPNGKFRWHWDPRFHPSKRDLVARHQRLEVCAANLELPVQLVRGGLSDVLSEAGAQEFLALCPHAEYVSIPNAAHMVAGDRNDVFGNAVLGFLSRVLPTRGAPAHPPHELRRRASPTGDLLDVP
jgi:pimeloyl-ACP methyl ester carboxylesterase